MATTDKVFIAALLLMAILSISHRVGVSAKCEADDCATSLRTGDKRVCKTKLRCVDKSPGCSYEQKKRAKRRLAIKGCSDSGIPIISAMSLFVAALFHML
uniref:Uncharacterized protein n=1 Tax=Magallana gigas TaxID=29159 RepID=A0A8W8KKP8_MAGGI